MNRLFIALFLFHGSFLCAPRSLTKKLLAVERERQRLESMIRKSNKRKSSFALLQQLYEDMQGAERDSEMWELLATYATLRKGVRNRTTQSDSVKDLDDKVLKKMITPREEDEQQADEKAPFEVKGEEIDAILREAGVQIASAQEVQAVDPVPSKNAGLSLSFIG